MKSTTHAICYIRTTQTHRSTLFPYTTLFRSRDVFCGFTAQFAAFGIRAEDGDGRAPRRGGAAGNEARAARIGGRMGAARDRKSTRLNSSHRTISYAVFCLKKKM